MRPWPILPFKIKKMILEDNPEVFQNTFESAARAVGCAENQLRGLLTIPRDKIIRTSWDQSH